MLIQPRIQKATLNEKLLLKNLMELYLHDFSEFDNADVDESGRFGYKFLDLYWIEEVRHPFVIYINEKPAGFVLVRQITNQISPTWSIAEFFVMRKYRGHRVGRKVAHDIFGRFQGGWVVEALEANKLAIEFWGKTIMSFTDGSFEEKKKNNQNDQECWVIWTFNSE